MADKRHKFPKNNKFGKQFSADYQAEPKAKSEGRRKAQTMRELAKLFGAGVPSEKIVEAYQKIYPEIDKNQVSNDLLVIAGQYHKAQTEKDTSAAKFITDLKGETKSGVEVTAPIQIVFSNKCKGL
jgi:hypothetical protein